MRGQISEAIHVTVSTSFFHGTNVTVTWLGKSATTNLGTAIITEDVLEKAKEDALAEVMQAWGIVPRDREILDELRKHTGNDWESVLKP
jgi:hypothetical protein